MIQLQLISKILSSKSISILEDNLIDEEYFVGYEAEYKFIMDHYKQYGNVPDTATFLSAFPEMELVEVTESDSYLVDTAREELLYQKSVPIVYKIRDLLATDANAAAEYMMTAIKDLQPNYRLGGIDIVSQADKRLDQFIERKNHQDDWFFTCGFEELDSLWHGIQRGEEFIVIVARINQGKSWTLEKICTHIWQLGSNVGYISPEMSANSIGYRFDTLYKNFSNKALMWGNQDITEDQYEEYINDLRQKNNKFIVATPVDFDRKITVSKLRKWIKQYKLDLIAIDGITYMQDERGKKGDNKTERLTNISEDLMSLSLELQIPVIVVVQANRQGVTEEDESPELEHIKDSDGIGANASKVLSIKQSKEGILTIQIKKQRFGPVGGKLKYKWNIDTGDYEFVPSYDDAQPKEKTDHKVKQMKKKYNDVKDVF